jgi:predicted metal-dependent phosphoesterase TrpH
MIQADFHIHTTASDGRIAPSDILLQAVQVGLTHISITDHDTVDGLLALGAKPQQAGVTVIAGIEFSTDMPDCEIHILGYGIDIFHPRLRQQLTLLKEDRVSRVRKMAAKITALGYPIAEQDIVEVARGSTSVGRPHVAKALIEKGYFTSVSDVFHSLLNRDKPGYVPHYKLTPSEVIGLISQAGGVSILAHPGLVGNDQQVRYIIESGIDGLEVYHPKHDVEAVDRYLSLAQDQRLLVTGGSDYHAIPGRFPERLGEFLVPNNVANLFVSQISGLCRNTRILVNDDQLL